MCSAPPRPRPEPQVAHILEHPLRPNPSPSPSPAHRTRPETGTRPGTPRTPRSTPGPGRPAARTLIRASGPERGAMRLTGHTSRTIFDRDPVRLEFPILSLNPGLRQRCVAPDVWGRRVAGGGRPDGRGARHRRRCTGCPSGARARGAPALAALERRRAHPRP